VSTPLNDRPRQTLRELLASYGRSLCDDPQRCQGLLSDLCGEHKREIHVLVGAIRERVPTDLLGSQGGMPADAQLARLARRLQDNLSLTEDAARWAVESWALALGLISEAPQRAVRKVKTPESRPVPRQKAPVRTANAAPPKTPQKKGPSKPASSITPAPPAPPRLSAQETQLLSFLLAGMSEEGLAERLGISRPALQSQIGALITKVGVSSYKDLKIWALMNHIQAARTEPAQAAVPSPASPPAAVSSPVPAPPAAKAGGRSIAWLILLAVGALVVYLYSARGEDIGGTIRTAAPPVATTVPPAATIPLPPAAPETVGASILPPPPPLGAVQPGLGTSIRRVWLEHNVSHEGASHLAVHSALTIARVETAQALVVAYFWRSTGAPMPALQHALPVNHDFNGQTALWRAAGAADPINEFNDFTLWIPYSALEKGADHFVTIEIQDPSSNRRLCDPRRSEPFSVW
jgi:DNA-binding CsgD family transcriptional regulator